MKYIYFNASRWNYSPVKGVRDALDKLEEAKSIGYMCDECGKVLIEQIIVRDGKRFHYNCR